MTALLWQSALLLLGSYFVGAFLGCLVRRTFFARTLATPELAGAGASVGSVPAMPAAVRPSGTMPVAGGAEPAVDRTRRFEEALTGRGADATSPARAEPARATPAAPAPPARVATPASPPATATAPERSSTSAASLAAAAAAAAAARAGQAGEPRDKPAAATVLPAAHGVAGPGTASAPIAPASQTPSALQIRPPGSAPVEAGTVPAPELQDFTRIRAIDTELQKRLHELGVRTYADIAGWKPGDVARIADALKLPGRIEQENWIEQAQILSKGGETYYSRRKMRGELPSSRPSPNEGERITVRVPAESRPAAAAADVAAVAVAATPSEPPLAAVAPEQAAATAAGGGRDQLQHIGGINAEIERLLNGQGVSRFSQIAEWSAAEITRFDQLLGFEGRIARENWIEQARVLANGGETAYSRAMARRLAMPSPPAAATAAATRAPADGVAPRSDIGSLRSVRSEAYRAEDADTSSSAAGRASDDLKRIRGIGVLIEKRLNALGVNRYEQIANWTAADIERFSEKLDFRGRIERENWVEQARILSAGGQTEFSRRVDRGDL